MNQINQINQTDQLHQLSGCSERNPLDTIGVPKRIGMTTTTSTSKDPNQYPALRNLQFSPIKEGEEQYMVLWDPTGLSQEKLVLPLNYFFLIQHFDGEHSLAEIGALYLKRFGEFLVPGKMD